MEKVGDTERVRNKRDPDGESQNEKVREGWASERERQGCHF